MVLAQVFLRGELGGRRGGHVGPFHVEHIAYPALFVAVDVSMERLVELLGHEIPLRIDMSQKRRRPAAA